LAVATTFNPGEPVFDQETGEPFIDPTTGDFVEAAPGLQVATADGRTLDGDDVSCAVYYRLNKQENETLRNRRIGVPYRRVIFEAGTSPRLAGDLLAGEALTTPGVASVTRVAVDSFNVRTRVLRLAMRILKSDGALAGSQFVVTG
jgi:hypothetical protein